MKKKGIIILITFLIIVFVFVLIFINPIRKVFDKYKIIDNDTVSYKYVDSYSEYLTFTNGVNIVNELKESDFDDEKTYLIFITDINTKNSRISEEENTTKLYFDEVKDCSSNQNAYVFEITKNSNYVEGYYNVTGKLKCSKGEKE